METEHSSEIADLEASLNAYGSEIHAESEEEEEEDEIAEDEEVGDISVCSHVQPFDVDSNCGIFFPSICSPRNVLFPSCCR